MLWLFFLLFLYIKYYLKAIFGGRRTCMILFPGPLNFEKGSVETSQSLDDGNQDK